MREHIVAGRVALWHGSRIHRPAGRMSMNGFVRGMEVRMRQMARSSAWVLVLLTALPGVTLGQEVKAGVATVIEGDVTTRRESLPRPVALKFRDDVLRRDTIVTAERSLARLLLGGKATVTVRERSQLTVTEVPGTSLVELGNGKVGVAVARERMRPGDVVEIRTPNAIIAVRGTVVIAELLPVSVPRSASSKAPAWQSNVYVMTGKVEAQELRGGVPFGPVYPVGRRQMFTVSPLGPPQVTTFPESRVAEITAGLQPSKVGAKGSGAPAAAKEAALRAAAGDLADPTLGDEERQLADWQFPRAPISPLLPAFADSSLGSFAKPDLSPSLPGPLAPPVSGPSSVLVPSRPAGSVPVQPTINARPPAIVIPARTPSDLGALNLGKASTGGTPTSGGLR
jgi:FecR protein